MGRLSSCRKSLWGFPAEIFYVQIGLAQQYGAFLHQPPVEWYDAKASERMPTLACKGGAPRSELESPMIAGGNHTIISGVGEGFAAPGTI